MNLIQRAKSQPEAFVQLYDHYVERVYHYLLRRLGQSEVAEDLCSQVWEKVLTKISSLRSNEEAGFAAWLFSIARNELNQHFRRHKKQPTLELPEIVEDDARGPEQLLNDELEAEHIRQMLQVLPPKQRETVELRYFADLKNKEIALILNVYLTASSDGFSAYQADRLFSFKDNMVPDTFEAFTSRNAGPDSPRDLLDDLIESEDYAYDFAKIYGKRYHYFMVEGHY